MAKKKKEERGFSMADVAKDQRRRERISEEAQKVFDAARDTGVGMLALTGEHDGPVINKIKQLARQANQDDRSVWYEYQTGEDGEFYVLTKKAGADETAEALFQELLEKGEVVYRFEQRSPDRIINGLKRRCIRESDEAGNNLWFSFEEDDDSFRVTKTVNRRRRPKPHEKIAYACVEQARNGGLGYYAFHPFHDPEPVIEEIKRLVAAADEEYVVMVDRDEKELSVQLRSEEEEVA